LKEAAAVLWMNHPRFKEFAEWLLRRQGDEKGAPRRRRLMLVVGLFALR
jgi:hypothetical protein